MCEYQFLAAGLKYSSLEERGREFNGHRPCEVVVTTSYVEKWSQATGLNRMFLRNSR